LSILVLSVLLALALPVMAGMTWLLWKGRRERDALRRRLEQQEGRLRQMLEAQEEERKRFSGTLYEEVGLKLQGLRFTLGRLASRLAAQQPEHSAELQRSAAELERAAREIRSLSDKLLPRILAERGLDAALSDLTAEVFRHTAIQASYQASANGGRYGQQVEIATYRIARELLSNAARHAGARRVEVALSRRENWLTLTVRDDGRGFDTEGHKSGQRGLEMIRSHAQAAGGGPSFAPLRVRAPR
jgi:signal transduction histidine kinase